MRSRRMASEVSQRGRGMERRVSEALSGAVEALSGAFVVPGRVSEAGRRRPEARRVAALRMKALTASAPKRSAAKRVLKPAVVRSEVMM